MNRPTRTGPACRRLVVLFAVCCAGAPAAHAQSRPSGAAGEVPRVASEVIATVMSPYCPGLLLSNCPSPSADSLRRAIVARAAAGATEADLRAELVAVYGEGVLAAPRLRGMGAVAWLVPFLLILLAGGVIARWIRRQRPAAAPAAPAVAAVAAVPGDAERLQRIADRVERSR
ncbi:MAG: cytochrome c-type biogenesis protein CcmH [Gemmatimonadaceae bacterium]|nr:cytochrome c-type biogenesis protein CcmH [Gemmatimonadaceae bacterium]